MPTTNTRTDYVTLYRTFAEMYENLDFIQTLERLQTGEPTNMHGSNSGSKIEGTNRPLARLAHGMDSLLDQMMLLKTAVVDAANTTTVTWNGTNLVTSASIEVRVNLVAAGQIAAAPSGKISYSILAFTQATASVDWGYVILPMDPTGTTTVSIATATNADFETALQGSDRMKILPVFYKNSAGNIVWMLGSQEIIHQDRTFYPGKKHNRFYSLNSSTQALNNISISGSGNVSWIKDGAVSGDYELTLPSLTITGPSISQTLAGDVYSAGDADELQDGYALFINSSDGSVEVQSLNSTDFADSDVLRVMICARSGNNVYFWNGLKLVGTSTASTGTTVDLFNFQQQLVRLVDDSTSFYLDIVSNSDSNFSENRTLTLDTGNADRTLQLKGAASTYTFNATSFSLQGTYSQDAGTTLQLQENGSLYLLGTSGSPSSISLNQASIDLEANCSIDLDSTSTITADNSTLALGTGNAVSFGANFSSTGVVSITSNCTIDQDLSTTSDVTHSGLELEDASAFFTISNFNNSTTFPQITSQHAHGTIGAPTSADASDYLLQLSAKGYNASSASYETGGYIYVSTDTGTVAAVSDDMPSHMRFGTSPGGGTAVQERMRILSNGFVGLGVSDPDAALEVFNTSTQLKLSYNSVNFTTFTVSSSGDFDIDTNSGVEHEVTINSERPRSESLTLVCKARSAATSNGSGIPTLDGPLRGSDEGKTTATFGTAVYTNLSTWGLTGADDRLGAIWVAPRNCIIKKMFFSSDTNFGNYTDDDALVYSTNNYPGIGNIAGSGWECPLAASVQLNIYKVSYNQTDDARGGFLGAGADVSVSLEASSKTLYGSIFDLGGDGTDGTTTWSESYAGRVVEMEFTEVEILEGEGFLIHFIDPELVSSSSSESATSRLSSNLTATPSSISEPILRVTVVVEYPI